MFHSLTVYPEEKASIFPSGEKAKLKSQSLEVMSVRISVRVAMSHSTTLSNIKETPEAPVSASQPCRATMRPSGENANRPNEVE